MQPPGEFEPGGFFCGKSILWNIRFLDSLFFILYQTLQA